MLFIILKISQGRFMCLVMLFRPRSTDEYPVLWKIHYRCILQKEVSQSSSSPYFLWPFLLYSERKHSEYRAGIFSQSSSLSTWGELGLIYMKKMVSSYFTWEFPAFC